MPSTTTPDCRCDAADYYADPCEADDCSVAYAMEFGSGAGPYTLSPDQPTKPTDEPAEVPDCNCWQILDRVHRHVRNCDWVRRTRRDCGHCTPDLPCDSHEYRSW
ncbi:hypothetical protein [[Kitasatospora] papulosa]|uniref:hypothetical protein n=1 Tax=[Kitasatospora] papulosa TaxID=1464011 RepID=UPI0038579062